MNKLLTLAVLSSILIGCSSKDVLKGKREDISLSEDSCRAAEMDQTPVIIDDEWENTQFTQPFLNSIHCHAPLKVSQNHKNYWSSVWTTKLDYEASKSVRMMASPIVADGKVFCIDAGGIVYAIDQKTGSRVWRVSTTVVGKDGQLGGSIAYDHGRIVVTSCFSECFSLDAKTGKILWRIKLPASSKGDGISIYDGKAFVLCSNSNLQAIDIDSGKILWSHSGTSTDSTFTGSASVAVADGLVFVAYSSGEIFALQIETGNPLWEALLSKISLTNVSRSMTHPRACPVVKDGIVYFTGSNEQVVAFETKTGKKLWSGNYGGVQTPSVSGNSIFILNSRSELVCLNRYTGELRWITDLEQQKPKNRYDWSLFKSEEKYDWYGQILVKDHLFMLSPEGDLYFVSVYDGKIKKTLDVSSDIISLNPVICDSAMYILTDGGKLSKYK